MAILDVPQKWKARFRMPQAGHLTPPPHESEAGLWLKILNPSGMINRSSSPVTISPSVPRIVEK